MVEDHRAGLGVDQVAYDTDIRLPVGASQQASTCHWSHSPIRTCGAAAHAPGGQRAARAMAGHHVSTTATALT